MEIRKTFLSDLPKETLYQAWISPEMTIEPVIRIESNPVVNGIFKLYSKSEHGEGVMLGKFTFVDPGNKLIYSWHWNGTGETTKVTVEFKVVKNGSEISLIHSGFTSSESKEMHDSGWDSYFKGLEDKILQEEPGPN